MSMLRLENVYKVIENGVGGSNVATFNADTKLDKLENKSKIYQAYIVNGGNETSLLPIVNRCYAIVFKGMAAYADNNVEADTAPGNNAYLVSATPVRNYHVATKKYVDDTVNNTATPYNDNILLNGNFTINQEGKVSYLSSSNKTVDMWTKHGDGSYNVKSKLLHYSGSMSNPTSVILEQGIENSEALSNKDVTLSITLIAFAEQMLRRQRSELL